jgi:chloride channel 2
MQRDLLYVWEGCTFRYIRHLLNSKESFSVYPYVKSPDSLILFGTVERIELIDLLENQLSRDRMIEDFKNKSTQSLNRPSPTCPVHGSQRFQVATIPEDEVLEITSVGVSFINSLKSLSL